MTATTQPQTTSRLDCLCNCGQTTSARANYRPGHDASHVSYLLQAILNSFADEQKVTKAIVKGLAKELPSDALRVKFTKAAERLIAKHETAKQAKTEEVSA